MSKSIPYSAILATVDRQYAETRARLASDAEYIALKARAAAEAIETPDRYFARNIIALHEEMNMPGITATVTRARSEYAARNPTWWQRMFGRKTIRSQTGEPK